MDSRLIPGIFVVAFLALILGAMVWAWRGRRRRDAAIPALPAAPESLHPILTADVFYVATSRAGQPLERLALPGLGFRARAELIVATEGLLLQIPGEHPVFIPADRIADASTATWTIDRVVESDGLIRVRWSTGIPTPDFAESYLRLIESPRQTEVLEAIRRLGTAGTAPAGPSTKEN